MCIYTVASPTVDVLIIGGGVAGSSAALTVIRQRHTAIMFDTSRYRFDNSYYLHALVDQEHVSPKDLITKTHKELEQFNGFTLKNTEITKLEKNGDHFTATDKDGKNYRGKKVILAHGVATLYPQIEGYGDCWGKGMCVHYSSSCFPGTPKGCLCPENITASTIYSHKPTTPTWRATPACWLTDSSLLLHGPST
jgi:thioredoxin reductase